MTAVRSSEPGGLVEPPTRSEKNEPEAPGLRTGAVTPRTPLRLPATDESSEEAFNLGGGHWPGKVGAIDRFPTDDHVSSDRHRHHLDVVQQGLRCHCIRQPGHDRSSHGSAETTPDADQLTGWSASAR